MKPLYFPFWEWEDIGMWRNVSGEERERLLRGAIYFTGNARKYGAAMLRVLDEFPIACQHNLTKDALNQQAWIGHAACFLITTSPEDVTREAWKLLTQEQRDAANEMADAAIIGWNHRHEEKNRVLCGQMEIPGVSCRDTGRSTAAA